MAFFLFGEYSPQTWYYVVLSVFKRGSIASKGIFLNSSQNSALKTCLDCYVAPTVDFILNFEIQKFEDSL